MKSARSEKTDRRCCGSGCLTVAFIVLGLLTALGLQHLPQPRDANGDAIFGMSEIVKVYISFFVHQAGLSSGTLAPHMSPEALSAAPPRWTLAPLPELHAGIDFTDEQSMVEAFLPFRNQKPVVIRDFLTHKDAHRWAGKFLQTKDWTADWIRKEVGEVEIRLFKNYTNDNSIVWRKFKDYIDEFKADPETWQYARALTEHWEASSTMVEALDQRLVSTMAGRPWLWSEALNAMHSVTSPGAMFISGRRPTTQMHSDVGESFVVHTEGKKLWRFFGPENTPLLKPWGMVKNVGAKMGSNVWNPDFEKNPELRLVTGWDSEVNTGDMIYFPSQTWHGVENMASSNIIVDIAFFDVFRSWRRNWPNTLAMLLHPLPAVDAFKFCYLKSPSKDGHRLPEKYSCMKEVYFQSFKTLPDEQ